jgi:U3 small nucleolar RNA-associated protein 20
LVPAQLKVNLRPLWSPACAALSSLSERFGDAVWKLIFTEITAISRDSYDYVSQHTEHDQANEENSDVWEEERSWRDPSAHKLHTTLAKWLDPQYGIKKLLKVRS